MKDISVVIPVYNSEECVAEISRQIADALKDFSYEQIMVNDASRDGSWAEIEEDARKEQLQFRKVGQGFSEDAVCVFDCAAHALLVRRNVFRVRRACACGRVLYWLSSGKGGPARFLVFAGIFLCLRAMSRQVAFSLVFDG